eukprot:77893-Rhodomonas_salina.3
MSQPPQGGPPWGGAARWPEAAVFDSCQGNFSVLLRPGYVSLNDACLDSGLVHMRRTGGTRVERGSEGAVRFSTGDKWRRRPGSS